MTWGNNGAGPTGVQPFAPGQVGQPPGQGGATLPPIYNAGFESLMAAVSRGEVSLNQATSGNGFSGNSAAAPQGNPTLMQAISQGIPQNGTNGLGVSAGPRQGEGTQAAGLNGTAFGGSQIFDAKQMENAPAVAMANPIQYGGA